MNANLTPKRLSWPEVWEQAEIFRKQYVKPIDLIPVPIEKIIEVDLGLEIAPKEGLKSKCDIEGFITCDLKTIVVDNATFNDSRYENRLRFTLAHEIGHFILHSDQISKMKFRESKDWIDFNLRQDNDNIDWLERQAKQFAGRLLVPNNLLIKLVRQNQDKIDLFHSTFPGNSEEVLIDHLAASICKPFGVSADVIKRRIFYEKIKL